MMRIRVVIVSGLCVLGAVASFSNQGCSNDDDERRTSRKGEACQVTNDCSAGLACVPVPGGVGGVCVTGEFHIAQTAKECALIQCKDVSDCCPTPPAQCAEYLSLCGDAGPTNTYCQQYEQYCTCDTEKRACENDRCVLHCATDTDCSTSGVGSKCAGGKCVQCASDDDCSDDEQCLNGKCQAPCETDGDCPGFNRCVTGKCVSSGCQTDRECVAATRNVEATCGTDGKCIVPCQTDLECGNPKEYSFFSCINSQCVYTGCETDKDCRLLFTGPSDAGTLPTKEHVVCRDRTTPGDVTKPAQ